MRPKWNKTDNKPPKGGRPKLSDAVKAGRQLNKEQSFDLVQKYAWITPALMVGMKPDEMPLYEQGIFRSFVHYAQTGDMKYIQFWVDHLVGSAPNSNLSFNLRKDGVDGGAVELVIREAKPKEV